jgi:hypothetical protein
MSYTLARLYKLTKLNIDYRLRLPAVKLPLKYFTVEQNYLIISI